MVYLCKVPGPCEHVVMGTRPDESRLIHDILLSVDVLFHVHTILCVSVCVCGGGGGGVGREERREMWWVSVQDHTS